MKRPNGVGDIQEGERCELSRECFDPFIKLLHRYLNVDYMFWKQLRCGKILVLYVSYDIACQWHKNLRERMNIYPNKEELWNGTRYVTYLVPKFHLPAHIADCNLLFSFNLTKGVGRTDGEAPERGWANINPLAHSTKEMGPGTRHDTIDNHFGDWNWKKVIAMGKL
jgi:hypothetical protein